MSRFTRSQCVETIVSYETFGQVLVYPTRNFATLGPSELRPPFTGPCIKSLSYFEKDAPLLLSFQHRAGVRPYTSCYHLAESCVFSKQSPPPILCHMDVFLETKKTSMSSFFRSYGGNLPSSFNMILS